MLVVLLTIPLVARQGGRDEEWYQKEVARTQTDSQYRHLDLSKVEDDIKNKVRSLEQKEKKRVKEEAARIAAAVAAVSASPSPPSRVASSNAEVVVSATAAVARALLVCHCLQGTNPVQERRQLVVLPHPMPRLLHRPT